MAEARLVKLESELRRLQDEREIENFMGRHIVNHNQLCMSKTLSFFALDEPDVSLEAGDRGKYVGRKALETLYQDQWGSSALKGNLLFPMATTPMIVVADDGKSARGVWRTISAQAVVPKPGFFDGYKGTGEPEAIWLMGAYAVSFVRKPEGWKMLSLRWYRTLKCAYDDGWVKHSVWTHTGAMQDSPDDLQETTYYNPYTATSIQDAIPAAPLPFETDDHGEDWTLKEE